MYTIISYLIMKVRSLENNRTNGCDEGRAQSLSLITIQDGKILVNERTAEVVCQYDQPICVVVACGEYRSGKSTLLNKLFYPDCFQVSSTTSSCTQGINLMSKPIHLKDRLLWVMDCEGFGSIEKDGHYDARMFLLCLLFSEVLLYNSFSSLDEPTIQRIGLMCRQAGDLVYQKLDFQQVKQTSLYWIIRDFSLSLVNKDGTEIGADEYFEESLGATQKNWRERQAIKSYFDERKCFPIVRPCISERNLQSLNNIPEQDLRAEFLEQLQGIRQKITTTIRSKHIEGRKLNGRDFVALIKLYIKTINQNDRDVSLMVAWEQVQRCQRQEYVRQYEERVQKLIQQHERVAPVSEQGVEELTNQIEVLETGLRKKLFGVDGQIIPKRNEIMSRFQSHNQSKIREMCSQFRAASLNDLQHKYEGATLSNFQADFPTDLQLVLRSWQSKLRGYCKSEEPTITRSVLDWLTGTMIPKWSMQFDASLSEREQTLRTMQQKEAELSQAQKQYATCHEQLGSTKQLLNKALLDITKYMDIIGRLEKVNTDIRIEFDHLNSSHVEVKSIMASHSLNSIASQRKLQELEEETRRTQEALARLSVKNSTLQQTLAQMEAQYESKLATKTREFDELVECERANFEQIIGEKDIQTGQLQRAIDQLHVQAAKDKQELQKDLRMNLENCLASKQQAHQQQMRRAQLIIDDLSQQILTLRAENQERENQAILVANKHEKIAEECRHLKNQQSQHRDTEEQLREAIKSAENRIEMQTKRRTQLQQEKQEQNSQIQQIMMKHKLEMKALFNKFEQSSQNQTQSLLMKYETSKKHDDLDRQLISNKLFEAAEKIKQLLEKEKHNEILLQQSHDQNQQLTNQIRHLRDKECEQCQSALSQMRQSIRVCQQKEDENVKLKLIIERQENQLEKLRRKKKQLSVQIERLIQLPPEQARSIQTVKQEQNTIVQIQQNSAKIQYEDSKKNIKNFTQEIQKRSENSDQNPEIQARQASLVEQRRQLQLCRELNEKLKLEIVNLKISLDQACSSNLKKNNLHVALKKIKSKQKQKQQQETHSVPEQDKRNGEQLLRLREQFEEQNQIIRNQALELLRARQAFESQQSEIDELLKAKQSMRTEFENRTTEILLKNEHYRVTLVHKNKQADHLQEQLQCYKTQVSELENRWTGRTKAIYASKIHDFFQRI